VNSPIWTVIRCTTINWLSREIHWLPTDSDWESRKLSFVPFPCELLDIYHRSALILIHNFTGAATPRETVDSLQEEPRTQLQYQSRLYPGFLIRPSTTPHASSTLRVKISILGWWMGCFRTSLAEEQSGVSTVASCQLLKEVMNLWHCLDPIVRSWHVDIFPAGGDFHIWEQGAS
jgi:hypothetical protein